MKLSDISHFSDDPFKKPATLYFIMTVSAINNTASIIIGNKKL